MQPSEFARLVALVSRIDNESRRIGTCTCTRSIRCNDPATATRCASRWRGSASPIARSKSTSCKAKAARRSSSPKIRAAMCRCSKSRRDRYLAEFERDPLVRRRRHDAGAGRPASSGAEAMQWMFFEQHSLEPNIGAAYFWLALIKGGRDLQTHALEDWIGERLSRARRDGDAPGRPSFFVADRYTIADIALYAYTPRRASVRLRPRELPGGARLARPGRGRARPRRDGLAAARRGVAALTFH